MSKQKYLIRLDDACPYMDMQKWNKIEKILDKYSIKPLIGIIPQNEDKVTMIQEKDNRFWDRAKAWEAKGWMIALHGYNHCYVTACGGKNPIHKRSEFAGLPYEIQKDKISEGYKILVNKGLKPSCFFAPSHTFDDNTIKVIKEVTPIRLLSDTFARYPYKYDNDFIIVPCQMGCFRTVPFRGYWTFCFHPNTMESNAMNEFESFIIEHKDEFIGFDEIPIETFGRMRLTDKLLSLAYLTYRKIRG